MTLESEDRKVNRPISLEEETELSGLWSDIET